MPFKDKVKVQIDGETPMLMHNDNIDWADHLEAWKLKHHGAKKSKAGDDRTPGFRWIGSLYHNNEVISIPTENLMSCFMLGAQRVLVPGGKNNQTFKSMSQSGLFIRDFHWPLMIKGKSIAWSSIESLMDEENFAEHVSAVEKLGFELHKKRAKIGMQKHIRVRPKFENWSISGEIEIRNEQITVEILKEILDKSGKYIGLGDWRPSPKLMSPGPWGMFKAKLL